MADGLSRDEVLARVRDRVLSLSEAERLELLRAALDDPSRFETLVAEDGVRALLEDPEARQGLLAALERPGAWERLLAWFERPATLLDLGAVAALVVAALAGYAFLSLPATPVARGPGAVHPIGALLSPQHITWLLALPEQQTVPAGIEITGRPDAVFSPGEPLHLAISLRAPARAGVLEEPAGGPARQVWPGLGQSPALVPRPSSGGPAIHPVLLEAPTAEGTHRLRLVVAPAELDLGALSPADFQAAAGRLTLVDLRYRVTRP